MVRAVGVEGSPKWAVREGFQEEAAFEQRRYRVLGRGKNVCAKAWRSGPHVHKEPVEPVEPVAGEHVGQRIGAGTREEWRHVELCRLIRGAQSDLRGSSTSLAARERSPTLHQGRKASPPY